MSIDAKSYSEGLTKALNSDSIEEMKKFLSKYERILPPVPDDKVLETSMRKLQVIMKGVYPRINEEATAWLLERGMSLGLR